MLRVAVETFAGVLEVNLHDVEVVETTRHIFKPVEALQFTARAAPFLVVIAIHRDKLL